MALYHLFRLFFVVEEWMKPPLRESDGGFFLFNFVAIDRSIPLHSLLRIGVFRSMLTKPEEVI